MKYNRRDFISITGLALSGSLLHSCKGIVKKYSFFTDEEAVLVIALCERIIPSDQDAGATEAGVIYYIDRQLSTYFQSKQELYRESLRSIQHYCLSKKNKQFEKLSADIQDDVLIHLEKGEIPQEEVGLATSRQQQFFRAIRDHTMQGYYGSPRHGGNRHYVSYRMMNLDYPQLVGQNRYKTNLWEGEE
jgi:gluconate 2-dehydrogenase gamma chain